METGQGYSSAEEYDFWEKWYQQHQHDEMTLADLHFIGEQLYHDRHACAIYGYAPEDAYRRGIRLIGRTVLEYCIDDPAQEIATEVESYLLHHGLGGSVAVVDLFAGSGNLLYHITRTLPVDQSIGFDINPLVVALTVRNLALIDSPRQITQGSWQDFDPAILADDIQTLVVIVDPPWGQGLTSEGLDLRATEPPVPDILATVAPRLKHPTLWVIKTYEQTVPASLDMLVRRFVHHQQGTFSSMVPGTNVGYVLGMTQGMQER